MSEIIDRCPICGEPTNVYMGKARKDKLCRKHGMMKNSGEISVNEDGLFFEVSTGRILNAIEKPAEKDNTTDNELTCLICGEPSNGKHFCIKCYHKYKDKSIDIRITNCKEIKILDQYGNLTVTCADGRKVRSRAEALISNFFYINKIRSIYEKAIYYNENGESKVLHPDFYLPDYDIYIEYNEIKKKSYLKSKEYAKKIYEQENKKVVIMDDKDLEDIEGFLMPKLMELKK